MAISKEALAVVESIAYKVHDTELHFLHLSLKRDEAEELHYFFEALKAQIGRFVMKYQSAKNRQPTDADESRITWDGLRDHSAKRAALSACRFCGSGDLKERPSQTNGYPFWYCNTCRQENRISEAG